MKKLEVVNPYDLSPIGEAPVLDWKAIDGYLEEAHRLYRNRSAWLAAHQRIAILERAAEKMKGMAEELALLIANEGGKPLIDARVEVARAIDGVGLCVRALAERNHGEEIPMDLTAAGEGRMAFTFREPIGPVVAVSAFNHPLNLIVHQVGPAVAAGCPVLVKPASDTPLSCLKFIEILYDSGLPEEWCRYAQCDTKTATRMVSDPRVAFLTFIGSAKVGWMLRSKLAPGARCALEHGGVAPVIVDKSADIESMIPLLVKGGYYHSGQVCVSVQKVFAPRSRARQIAEEIAAQASKLVVGNAIEEKTECGPLIRPAETGRIAEWVEEAIKGGAECLTGGSKLGETSYAPTLLLDPPEDARVSRQEVFGPVVCVYSYDDMGEAISQANSLPFAFQAAVFTRELASASRCLRELDAAAVMVNDHTAFRVDWMPFAGRRHSGYGIGGIAYTMHDMTTHKLAVIKL